MSKKFLITILILVVFGVGIYLVLFKKEPPPPPQVVEIKPPEPSKETIGISVEGRKIESFTYGAEKHPQKRIVLVGGIHGGYEWNGVLLAYSIMDYLKENPEIIPNNIKVTVIPSMNPDGLYKVVGKEGRFDVGDVSKDPSVLASGRFNANLVDLNRNFECKWKPTAIWRSKTVSAGASPFSEPESMAIKDFATKKTPDAFVFFHSQADAVYASECGAGILPETTNILNAYSKASGYKSAPSFTSYVVTGDVTDWLASVKIPAISVELKTRESIEFEKNLAGFKALLDYFKNKI